jgi:hypothetical protein
VIRDGIIASPYPVPYQGNQYFLVDAQLHPGTSGGPVITKFKNMWQHKEGYTITEGWGMYLLGINASTAKIIPNEMPLGLNATYFAEILEKMTSLIK